MALGEANDVWRNLPEDLRPVRPEVKVADFSGDVVEISDRKLKAVFGSCYVSIARGKKYRLGVYCREGDEVKSVVSGVEVSPTQLDYLDLDPDMITRIKFYISMWDYILEKREAEIYLKARIKVMPKVANDKEALAYEIARHIVNDYGAVVLKMNIHGKLTSMGIHCYDGVVWVECSEKVKNVIKEYLTNLQILRVTKNVVEEVVKNKIELLSTKVIDEAEDKPLVAFENDILDWETFMVSGDLEKALKPPSKDLFVRHRIRHRIDLKLVKEARSGLEVYIPPRTSDEIIVMLKVLSPRSYELLKSWVWYDGISEELLKSRIAFLLEAIGRALIPGYRLNGVVAFKDIFVFLGPGDAGKTTFLRDFLGKVILGNHNYVTTRLRYLGSDDEEVLWRTLGALYNYLAVIIPDVGKKDKVNDWSIIRSISGGDPVTARKLRENPFNYLPHYKFYIGSNDPPPINEEGDAKEALLSRFKVIEFKNRFKRDSNFRFGLNEVDLSTLIICSVYAIRLAFIRGGYSFTGVYDVEDAWNRYAYPAYKIVIELIESKKLALDPNLRIETRDLYNMAVEYINERRKNKDEEEEEEGQKLPDQKTFTDTIKKCMAKYGVKLVVSKGKRYFKGLGIPPNSLLR